MTSKKLVRPGSRLVVHDIHVETVRLADGSEKVCAYSIVNGAKAS